MIKIRGFVVGLAVGVGATLAAVALTSVDEPASPEAGSAGLEPADPPASADAPEVSAEVSVEVSVEARSPLVSLADGLPTSGQWRQNFAIVDVDTDGREDLVFGPARKGRPQLAWFRQLSPEGGRLAFERRAIDAPRVPSYGAIASADLNGDGRGDLGLALHHHGVRLLVARGDGAFAGDPLPESLAAMSSRALALADLDGDEAPEIIALADGPRVGGTGGRGLRIARRSEDGWADALVPGSEQVFADSLAIADLVDDARPEIVIGSAVTGERRLLCRGDARGSWACGELPGLPEGGLVRAVSAVARDAPQGPRIILASHAPDPERSGRWRVAVLELVPPVGDASWTAVERFADDGDEVLALATGDLDRDGTRDIVATRMSGEVIVLAGAGGALHHPPPKWRAGCRGYAVAVTDLDRDGSVEIVASFAGESSASLESLEGPSCRTGGGIEVLGLQGAARLY